METVDWSKLPTDLLNLISQRIDDDELDLIRFRSVCSTWRSSSVPNHHYILPYKFPVFKLPFISEQNDKNPPFCHLSKQNIFLIKPPQQQQEQQTLLRPWLIRVSQNTRGKTRFFHPLFCDSPLPRINLILDFRKLSLLHLGSNTFTRDFDTYSQHQPFNSDYMFPEKVIAVTCHGKNPLIVATISSHPEPLLSKCGNEKWKVIPDMSMEFGDICLFKGRAYAVDKIGKTIMVGSDSNVHLVAEPLDGGENKKLLVESDGDLLLACVHAFPVISVDLFKLNEKEKKWVKLTSLGDKVLFLGIKCSFSASFSDLYVAKGNCVIISADIFRRLSRLGSQASYVLDLDQGWLPLLCDSPEYSNLFWPPPKWI
ncbi:putative F-box domain-containing protein [Medicago truncatula]|uniref:F-box SKIP23-like protein n=1 Tax=Medicago truncatula TaxID=3880 RepID=G7KMS3_MEDTR|nr:F-box protein SKIP23 isoform X1 [Medicago truncatula]AES74963.1 F-box SKIP23-like protein [Medicago truncatula]RHN50452.1 putative F-box domain-containing protein [Medicago truncatula]